MLKFDSKLCNETYHNLSKYVHELDFWRSVGMPLSADETQMEFLERKQILSCP